MVRKLGAIVIVLVLVAGFLIYINHQLQQQRNQSPVISQTGSLDDWETVYMETSVNPITKNGGGMNLEIKYPKDWFYLSGKELGGTGGVNLITSYYTNKIEKDIQQDRIQVQIMVLLSPEEGLDNFANDYMKSSLISPEKIKIGSFNGYKGITDGVIKYLLSIDEYNIAHIYVAPNDSTLVKVSDQVLSTLKLVN